METLKNLLSPGKDRDNEQLYGTGENTNTAHSGTIHTGGLSGEGSHFAKKTTTGHTTGGSNTMPGGYPNDSTTGVTSRTNTNTTAGPHSSNFETEIDPRVDSDNSRGFGGTGAAANLPGVGYPNTSSSTTAGPHSSSLVNKTDSRVYSDRSRSQDTGNHGTTHTGVAPRTFPLGSNTSSSTTAGPHSSNLENKIDPRVDSDRDGSGGQGSSAHPMMDRSYPIQTGYGNSSTNTGSSGHNLGRDAAALGAGVADGSAIHHHQNQGNVGSNIPSSGTVYDNSTTHTRSSGHNFGRDAAVLGTAGAAGAAGSAVHHHQNQGHLGSNTYSTGTGLHGISGPHQTETANRLDPHVPGGGSRLEDAIQHHEHQSTGRRPVGGGAEEADRSHRDIGITSADATRIKDTDLAPNPELTGHNNSTSHTGRNAALGAGAGLGATGLAKHEHGTHHADQSGIDGNSGVPHSGTGTVHSSGLTGTSGSNNPNTGIARGVNTTGQSGHHGREVAGTGAGLGAAGIAKYEHDRHNNERSNNIGSNPTTVGTTTTTTNHHGHHDNRDTTTSNVGQSTTHHGRDAALGTGVGVGAAGLAKHEYDKHQVERSGTVGNAYPTTGTNTSATEHDLKTNFGNYPAADQSTAHHGSTSHHGDAARGTNAAAIVREAEISLQEKGRGPEGKKYSKDYEKEHKHEQKEHEKELKEHKREEKHAHEAEKQEKKDHKGGIFSFLHRNKNRKYTDDEEKEFERQEREHKASQSHHGRDAAGGAALGAGAAGAYEANKHHGQSSDTNKSLPTAPGNYGVGIGAGTQNALADQPGHGQYGDSANSQGNIGSGTVGLPGTKGHHATTSQHLGRDATPMTSSGVGAAALGEHDHNKHYTTSENQSSAPHLGTHSGTYSGTHPTGQHGLASDQPRLSEADFDQGGNPIVSHHSHLPPAYGTYSGSDGRNRLHKGPPAGHPAAQAMAGQSTVGHSSTHDGPGRHENLTGRNDGLASDSVVKNAGGNTY